MKWPLIVFTVAYIVALALLAVGTFGLLGQERDPLAGIFLLPLGLPWNILIDRMGGDGPTGAMLSPAINCAILYWLWRRKAKNSA